MLVLPCLFVKAPEISPEMGTKLEDMIKQRIKDKAFDDVERKVKPVEMNYEYKKQVTLDNEKSKQSLSQVYEQEFLNKTAEAEVVKTGGDAADAPEQKNPKHDEIRKGLESLFIKLDSLSNFHYTPKAVGLAVTFRDVRFLIYMNLIILAKGRT